MSESADTVDMIDTGAIESSSGGGILAHAQQFDPDKAHLVEPPAPGSTDEGEPRTHHSSEQRRDREGQFQAGKKRAKSQTATPEDVTTIQELSRKIKEAEGRLNVPFEEREGESERVRNMRRRLEILEFAGKPSAGTTPAVSADAQRIDRLERELERLRSRSAPKEQVRAAERRVDAAGGDSSDPEPSEEDPKYNGDWNAFHRDLLRWDARQVYRQERERETKQASARSEQQKFEQRVNAARQKHQGFDDVANRVIQRVPQGSAIEQFFFSQPDAEDVVMYLGSHPQELDDLLRQPDGISQIASLSMIRHRLSSAHAPTAGATTAAQARFKNAPKPPTVVRPEANRSTESSAQADTSILAHAKKFGTIR